MHSEHHSHHHGHSHAHAHGAPNYGFAFAFGILLNSLFVAVEVFYGFVSHSLALIADAGHNLGDVLGLFLAWGASALGRRVATERHSYGLKRSTVLAALANAVFLLVAVGAIVLEAAERFNAPASIQADTVIWVAVAGIVINAGTALMFMKGRKGDLNIRGAFLHMAADAVLSAGVVVGAVVILYTGWQWVDPALSILLAVAIVYGAVDLLWDSLNLALDAVPEGIDARGVRRYLSGLPSVKDVHHLHIWGLSTTESALTVHLVLDAEPKNNELLHQINHDLHDHFGIGHATIQFETAGEAECCAGNCR